MTLTQKLRAEEEKVKALSRLLQGITYERSYEISNNEETKKKCEDAGSYPFIPMAYENMLNTFLAFKNHLEDVRQGKPFGKGRTKTFLHYLTFMDAGCGIGNMLALAYSVGFGRCIGVEFDSLAIEKGHELFNFNNRRKTTIRRADILRYRRYSKADFIYFYCPMRDPKKELKFELRVAKMMRVGTYISPCGIYPFYADPRFKEIHKDHPRIFEKTNDQEIDPDEVRKKAF